MTVKHKYYIALGNTADDVRKEILDDKQECKEKQLQLLADYGADALLMIGRRVVGLGFVKELKSKRFFKFLKKDNDIYYYVPDRRFLDGNELSREMDNATEANWSYYACLELKAHTCFTDSKGEYHISEAELTKDGEILLKVPYSDKMKLPDLPQNLVPISQQEYEQKTKGDDNV